MCLFLKLIFKDFEYKSHPLSNLKSIIYPVTFHDNMPSLGYDQNVAFSRRLYDFFIQQ